ncbi:dihydrofolate reductase family protein [Pseudactinotalea terrae]|uniref:dihydrofolate reductase family protein n=1 Tax=Pseudactinotalea terrae TaxID=1743262 RepID=UPI0012E25392|nr:dihydrofolate reductase family protein [Pseudactinotalea terrae]
MKLAVTQFITLDGVSQGPGSADEDTSDGFDRGGWLVPYIDDTFIAQASAWLDLADGLLLGRRTYEAFGRDWPQISEPDPFTARMNGLPKYVVSSTLTTGLWSPTTLLGGEAVTAVEQLKRRPGRELQVHGSARLASTLLAAALVDTLRLVVAPCVIGRGRRLLSEPDDVGLRLVSHRATGTGLLLLDYETTGPAPRGDYAGVADLA